MKFYFYIWVELNRIILLNICEKIEYNSFEMKCKKSVCIIDIDKGKKCTENYSFILTTQLLGFEFQHFML